MTAPTDPKPGQLCITLPSYSAPGALCRIARVTPTRLYVTVEDWGDDINVRMHSQISGAYGPTPYVDRNNVFAGPVTAQEYAAYKVAHKARQATIKAATKAADNVYKAELARIFGEEPQP
jgi:hypothetical protein